MTTADWPACVTPIDGESTAKAIREVSLDAIDLPNWRIITAG